MHSVSDSGVSYISNLQNLRDLYINSCGLYGIGSGFGNWYKMKSLQNLYLSIGNINDDIIRYISQVMSLKVLSIGPIGNQVTGNGLNYVCQLSNLEKLRLYRESTFVHDRVGFANFSKLTHLRILDFGHVVINDQVLLAISSLAQLEELRDGVANVQPITDIGIAHICHLTKLKELQLTCTCDAVGEGFASWHVLGNLQILNMSGCRKLTNLALERISPMYQILRSSTLETMTLGKI